MAGVTTMAMMVVFVLAFALFPAPSTAFFFGVQLTNPAGGVIGATNPTQTGVLTGLGLAAGTLGALGLAQALKPRPQTTVVYRQPQRYNRYHGRTYYRRGKRQAGPQVLEESQVRQVVENAMQVISSNQLEGCFQRLFCDIAAKPSGFERDLPIVNGARLAQDLDVSAGAVDISKRLLRAFDVGSELKDVKACEAKFSQCQWTGEQMDKEIERMTNAAAASQQQQQ